MENRGSVSLASLPPAPNYRPSARPYRTVKRELGLTVSLGVAPNRLLAKLASAAAKPDGIRVVPDQAAALQLLAQV